MTEGEQADIAEQQIEGAGEQRETISPHHELRIEERGRRDRREKEDCIKRDGCGIPVHQPALPKRPAGLIRSTMAMITKITVLEASG